MDISWNGIIIPVSGKFIDRYEAVVDTLDSIYDERKEAEVFGVRTMVMQKNTVAMILLLYDVKKFGLESQLKC